ncbi:MAG: AAA family ATPase [Actinomycetota bacterium]|nr:AAA family ATPase [Actinomycetota bacterium]
MDKQKILSRLDIRAYYAGELSSLKVNGNNQAQALCPFHEDKNPSLSVNIESGDFHCFGCEKKGSIFDFYMGRHRVDFKAALEALANEAGLVSETQRTIKEVYDYTDKTGAVLFQALRYQPKGFYQRRPDGKGGYIPNLQGVRLVPFNLPEVLKAKSVIICEGEKDCLNLKALGLTATCNPMGAEKWRPEYNEYFKGKRVAILPDNDEPGRKHAHQVAQALKGTAESVKVVELPGLPVKGDVSDWLAQDGTKADLLELIEKAPAWESPEIEINKLSRLRAVSAEEFLKLELPPREIILNPWLPTQGLAMIHAYRGVGKTFSGLGIGAAIASAGTFLRWTASVPKGVLYLDGEMPAITMQERLAAAIIGIGKPLKAPFKLITPDLQETGMPDLSTPEGQAEIEPFLTGISVVIVDNISTLFSGVENKAEDWAPAQAWALHLRRRGISAVFFHHDGKGGFQRGTSKKEDVLDTVIQLKRPADYCPDEGARFEVHFEKARGFYGDDAKAFEAKLTFDGEGQQTWALKDLEDSLTEKVARLLNDGLQQKDVAIELKVTPGTVSKHKKKAQEAGLLRADK